MLWVLSSASGVIMCNGMIMCNGVMAMLCMPWHLEQLPVACRALVTLGFLIWV